MVSFLFTMNKKPASTLPPSVGHDSFQQSSRKFWLSTTTTLRGRPDAAAVKDDTATRKKRARASITSLFQPIGLKRKRTSSCSSATAASIEDEDEKANQQGSKKRRTYHIDTVTRIIKVFSSTTPKNRPQKPVHVQPSTTTGFADVLQYLVLPTIEWTNGCLGILESLASSTTAENEHQQEATSDSLRITEHGQDSIMFADEEFMVFPSPPAVNPANHLMQLKRCSCPPRFESLIMIEEEESDDDDDDLPVTPTTTASMVVPDCQDDNNNALLSLKSKVENLSI